MSRPTGPSTTAFALAAALAAPLHAQRLPDPIDNRLEIQIHDVRSVLEAIGAASEDEADVAEAAGRIPRLDSLAGFCRGLLQPPAAEPFALQPLGRDLLVLRGSPQQQACLDGILRALSRIEQPLYTVECQLVQVPQAAFAGTVAPLLGLGKLPAGGGGTAAQRVLGAKDAAALRAALQKTEGVDFVQNPRMMMLAAQKATMKIANTVYYRKDYEVEVVAGKVKVWPITGKLDDGLSLELALGPVDPRHVGVLVQATEVEVSRPIPTFETTIGVDNKVVVDLPQSKVRRFEAALRLADGDLGVVVSGAAGDDHRQLLLVRVPR